MLIGTLQSMSYLNPKKGFWNYFARKRQSQTVSLEEQYHKYGVRVFDLHIYFTGKNLHYCVFKYGNEIYDGFSVFEALSFLSRCRDKVYVKMVLEDTSKRGKENEELAKRFDEYCSIIELIFPDVNFYGGYRECDGEKIHTFNKECPTDVIFYKRIDKVKNYDE